MTNINNRPELFFAPPTQDAVLAVDFVNIADNQGVYKSIGHFGQVKMNAFPTKKPTLGHRAGFF